MADDIKSLATRIAKLETSMKGTDTSVNELERKGKYLQGILDDINSLKDRVAALEKKAGIH